METTVREARQQIPQKKTSCTSTPGPQRKTKFRRTDGQWRTLDSVIGLKPTRLHVDAQQQWLTLKPVKNEPSRCDTGQGQRNRHNVRWRGAFGDLVLMSETNARDAQLHWQRRGFFLGGERRGGGRGGFFFLRVGGWGGVGVVVVVGGVGWCGVGEGWAGGEKSTKISWRQRVPKFFHNWKLKKLQLRRVS